jgi:micrococcal nuclease
VAIADQAEGIAQSPAAATPTAEGPLSKPASKEAAAVNRTGESAPVETRVSGVPGVLFPVVAIVDGDTIKVSIDGNVETLRLIGIDTPETKDPRKPVQCFGKEASAKAAELLSGRRVRLEADPTQGDRDKYGRLLRYLWREDGLFFNEWMIRNGYAHEYTYNLPYMHQGRFKSAERFASENNLGLWNPAACAGATTEAAARLAPAPPLQTGGGGHIFYTSSHSSARFYYCDTDPQWEGLSKSYLKSFPSENALLTAYPSRALHEPCE